MPDRLPLPSLLSQAFVAFTIEFDNEFEHRTPHRTTSHGSTAGSHAAPWLVSMAMWSNFMRFVPESGIPVRELQRFTGFNDKELQMSLTRMSKWWGYVIVEPDATKRLSSTFSPGSVVRPTPGGVKSLEVWRPLTHVIEERWERRFGRDTVDRLRESLSAISCQLAIELPDNLPILGYGLFSRRSKGGKQAPVGRGQDDQYRRLLPTLLSRVLLGFAVEFECGADISLAICSNVLRLLGDEGLRVRELPKLSAVSKEAIATSLSFLGKRGYTAAESEAPGSRVKIVMPTAKGRKAREAYRRRLHDIEERWRSRFGQDAIHGVRNVLELLAGEPGGPPSPLFRGLEPYPEGWRASIPRPEGLPHYPMILHRGGFPDGS